MPLTDTQIRNLKPREKSFKISDGGRLFLHVKKTGTKLWRLAYDFEGKAKTLSFGKYPHVSLAQARERRAEAKALLAQGIDPSEQKKVDKETSAAKHEHTFSIIAAELLEKLIAEDKAEGTIKQKRRFHELANADLADRPISEITAAEVLKVLKRAEAKGNYETARRLRTNIGQVFRFAIATARAENDPTYALRDALIAPKVKHMAAATSREDYARVLQAIWNYHSGSVTTRAALKLMALLYPRPGELRQAFWSEFDLEAATWTLPASRTKMRREHIKPLSGLAVEILARLQAETPEGVRVFPSSFSRDRPMSENTMNQALRRMGFERDEMTSHGFRASASSLLNESGYWNPDAIEAELAHVGSNQIRRAYHRATYWEERKRMSEWWAGEIIEMVQVV